MSPSPGIFLAARNLAARAALRSIVLVMQRCLTAAPQGATQRQRGTCGRPATERSLARSQRAQLRLEQLIDSITQLVAQRQRRMASHTRLARTALSAQRSRRIGDRRSGSGVVATSFLPQ